MSFVFRGTRADLESGFPGFIPERRAVRVHPGGRPVNANSMAFLVTVVEMISPLYLSTLILVESDYSSSSVTVHDTELTSDVTKFSGIPSLKLLWLVLGVFLMATSLRMYATCQQLQAQAQAHAAAASGLLGHTELRLHMPPSIAFATRGRLQGLRLQLALLDREFDDLDYDALRALDNDNSPGTPSMSEEEINTLPVHNYKVLSHQSSSPQNEGSSLQWASSSASMTERRQDLAKLDGNTKNPNDELTCSVCLEQVNAGELIRSLPCLHQFHANCIDPWLRQQGTCPVCKFKAASGWQENPESGVAGSFLV